MRRRGLCLKPEAEGSASADLVSVVTATAVAVLATFLACFGRLLPIVGEVAAAVLAAFLPGFGGTLRVVGEVATAVLSAFLSGFRGALGIVGEIAATVLPALAADLLVMLLVVSRRGRFAAFTPCFVYAHAVSFVSHGKPPARL